MFVPQQRRSIFDNPEIARGDSTIVDSLLFGAPSSNTQAYIRNQIDRFASSAIGEYAQDFANRARNMYESFNGAAMMNRVQAALNQVVSLSKPDAIYRFTRIEDIQTAQARMQACVMANPVIRQAYFDQRIDGYSDTYVDKEPGKIGPDHSLYRAITSGMVVCEGNDVSWTSYSDAFADDENEKLTGAQKHDVHASWNLAIKLLKEGEFDPTSPWNSML